MASDCIEWPRYRNPAGYGHIKRNGRNMYAHRVAAAMKYGDIRGAVIMHTCDNPPCVNPEHLRVGTYAENNEDSRAKGRSPVAAQHGSHSAYTYGCRCRECKDARMVYQRQYRRRKREERGQNERD